MQIHSKPNTKSLYLQIRQSLRSGELSIPELQISVSESLNFEFIAKAPNETCEFLYLNDMWDDAFRACDLALRLNLSGSKWRRHRLNSLAKWSKLMLRHGGTHFFEPCYSSFAISLPEDSGNVLRMQKMAPSLRVVQFNATFGNHLPLSLFEFLDPNSTNYQFGTFGVFMSHVRLWEHVRESGAPIAIFEDDISVSETLICLLMKEMLNGDWDIIWFNDRIVSRNGDKASEGWIQQVTEMPSDAIGLDGYFISPRAAAYLIDAAKGIRWHGHVDRFVIKSILKGPGLKVGVSTVAATLQWGRRSRRIEMNGPEVKAEF